MGESELDTILAKLAATPERRSPVDRFSGSERFEVLRPLGGGAFGQVYEARDREYGTRVALKVLKSSNPDWVYRFKREFRIISDLWHPNVARLYELFFEDDRWYLTMELVDGLPFAEHLERAPDQLRSCFAQLASAIAALHRAGCVHRDIKPSNVLVESSGRVVLLDFGLAVEERGALHTAVAGTPPYMAPELGMGDQPEPSSDWYAFGVMLYESLTGRLPFVGTQTEIASQKLAGNPTPPLELCPEADPALAELALRLLRPLPDRRPGAVEVLAELAPPEPSASRAPPDSIEIVGRDREVERLLEALEGAEGGETAVVTMHGEPGIGKSSILEIFARRAGEGGATLLLGRCHETESVPYTGLDGAVDMLCRELQRRPTADVAALIPDGADALVQMFPVLKRVEAFARVSRGGVSRTPQEARRAASEALAELLRAMAREAPVILAIDDLQWASDDGARLVARLAGPGIVVVAAYRSTGQGGSLEACLEGLEGAASIHIDLPVGPLDRDGVATLLGPETEVPLERVMRETGGHPYLLARLVESRAWGDGAPDLQALLAAQIGELAAPARTLLEVVALAAAPLTESAAFGAMGAARDVDVLDELRRRRLLSRRGGTGGATIEAYHDRVREVAVSMLSAERRRDLHRRLAEFFEARGRVDPEAVAHHFRQAGEGERALEWTLRAARHASASLAFSRAAELHLDAVRLAVDDAGRLALLEGLAAAQVEAGRRFDAGETCLEAAELAERLGDPAARSRLRAGAGGHFLIGGHLDRGLALIGEALAAVDRELPPTATLAVAHSINIGAELATRGLDFLRRDPARVDPPLLARVDLELDVARALSLTDIRAPWVATRATLDALAVGDAARIQRALAFFALSNSARAPDHELIVEACERARQLAVELEDEVGTAWAALAEGFRHMQRDDFAQGLPALAAAERRFLSNGPAYGREAALARLALVVACGNFGVDIAYARRAAPACREEALARGDLFAANWSRMILCWVDLIGDDAAAAREAIAEARETWPRLADSLFAAIALINEVAIDLYDAPETAWDTVERIEPDLRRLYSAIIPMPRRLHARLAANAAMAAYRAGRASATETRRRLEPIVEDAAKFHQAQSVLCVATAHLRALEGDRRGWIAALRDARDQWARCGQSGPRAAAALRVAQLEGDEVAARAAAEALREQTVADPERYALLFPGPPA